MLTFCNIQSPENHRSLFLEIEARPIPYGPAMIYSGSAIKLLNIFSLFPSKLRIKINKLKFSLEWRNDKIACQNSSNSDLVNVDPL